MSKKDSRPRRPTTTSLVMQALATSGPLTQRYLTHLIDEPGNRVSAAVCWLEDRGLVRKDNRDRWQLTKRADPRRWVVYWVVTPITKKTTKKKGR